MGGGGGFDVFRVVVVVDDFWNDGSCGVVAGGGGLEVVLVDLALALVRNGGSYGVDMGGGGGFVVVRVILVVVVRVSVGPCGVVLGGGGECGVGGFEDVLTVNGSVGSVEVEEGAEVVSIVVRGGCVLSVEVDDVSEGTVEGVVCLVVGDVLVLCLEIQSRGRLLKVSRKKN